MVDACFSSVLIPLLVMLHLMCQSSIINKYKYAPQVPNPTLSYHLLFLLIVQVQVTEHLRPTQSDLRHPVTLTLLMICLLVGPRPALVGSWSRPALVGSWSRPALVGSWSRPALAVSWSRPALAVSWSWPPERLPVGAQATVDYQQTVNKRHQSYKTMQHNWSAQCQYNLTGWVSMWDYDLFSH